MSAVQMVTVDCADPRALARFWMQVLDRQIEVDTRPFVVLGGAPALGFQWVPDPTPGKNRVHLDLHTQDRQAEVERLLGLGATRIGEEEFPGIAWTVMADPEGNVFCVAQPRGEQPGEADAEPRP